MRLRTSLMTSSNVGTRQSKDGGVGAAAAVCCCRREVSAEIDSCDASISSLSSSSSSFGVGTIVGASEHGASVVAVALLTVADGVAVVAVVEEEVALLSGVSGC